MISQCDIDEFNVLILKGHLVDIKNKDIRDCLFDSFKETKLKFKILDGQILEDLKTRVQMLIQILK